MDNSIKAIKEVLQAFKDNNFSVSVYEENGKECGLEIEGWTSGGVDMIHFLDFRYGKNIFDIYDILDEVKEIVTNFDVDEVIDSHREDKDYRSAFTCRQSVDDFSEWEEHLRELAQSVSKVVEKWESILTEFDFEDLGTTMRSIIEG
jgi:hypothetical protein